MCLVQILLPLQLEGNLVFLCSPIPIGIMYFCLVHLFFWWIHDSVHKNICWNIERYVDGEIQIV
jgi:hypothetical protein